MGWHDGEATATLADEAETDVDVEFRYCPGWPGRGPSLSDPGDPPEGPEIEIGKVYRKGTREEIEPTEAQLEKLYEHILENEDLERPSNRPDE